MASGNVDILLTARDQYSRQLEDMKNRVRSAQRDINSGALGGIVAVDQLARAFRAMGTARLVIDTASAAMGLFKGNTEEAVEALKRMPFGIGATTRSIEDFLSGIMGVTAATERLKKAESDLAAQRRQLAAAQKEHATNEQAIAAVRQRTEDELRLIQTPEGFALRREQLTIERRKALEEIERLEAQHLSVKQDRELLEVKRHLFDLFGLKRAALDREEFEEKESLRRRQTEELNRVRDSIARQAEAARERLRRDVSTVERRSFREPSLAAFESRFLTRAPTSAAPREIVQVRDYLGNLVQLSQRTNALLTAIEREMPDVEVLN